MYGMSQVSFVTVERIKCDVPLSVKRINGHSTNEHYKQREVDLLRFYDSYCCEFYSFLYYCFLLANG